jgi:site-specific DNA recombinase
VPYGYRVEGRKKLARLLVSETPLPALGLSESDVVRLIYRMLAEEGLSCVKIAEHLNAIGAPPAYTRDARKIESEGPDGKRLVNTAGIWRPSRIRNLVVNPVYKGEHVYGKRSKKPRELIRRSVPAIVDGEVWANAQAALHGHQIFSARNSKRKYLLRDLIKCGTCGLNYHIHASVQAQWAGRLLPVQRQ